jgi:DNA-binding CsgD family transcriptional regulator
VTYHAYLEQALDSLNQALIILNDRQQVVYMTAHAAIILAENDGLTTRNGELSASLNPEDLQLRSCLDALCSTEGVAKEELRIHRPSGKRPYKLRINALQAAANPTDVNPNGALVIIQDLHANHQAWFDRLRERYKLTPRECECTVLLAEGNTIAEVAERMEISMQTLRQHLKHAFQKSGTHKQHELVGVALQALRKR